MSSKTWCTSCSLADKLYSPWDTCWLRLEQ